MSEITEQIRQKLTEANSFSSVEFSEINNFPSITVPKEKILEIARILKDEFKFDQLRDIVGVDRFTKEERFECIYNLYSTVTLQRLIMRVRLDSKKPEVESMYPLWLSADWAEREAYDMTGIVFLNHPDLRRMYMMEEYEYYPLRKDYPLMGLPGAVKLPKK
jgi:NADH-quinone oxidoreductase subunit C